MNCDRCGKPSVFHSTLIINGVSQTTNLCRECAIKEGVFNSEPKNIFDEFFSPFADLLSFDKVADIACPVCKTTLKEFKSLLKLGCPNCYESFNDEISKLIKRISPYESHKVESLNFKKNEEAKKPKSKEAKIAELRVKMSEAVNEERYEDAAKIKKEIQKLEKENE